MLLLANEFLDALPIRQFVRRKAGWMERFVENGRFVEQSAAPSHDIPSPHAGVACPPALDPGHLGEADAARPATIHELNEPALGIAQTLGARFTTHPGAALFLDYGPEHSAPGDSLQALRNGRPADPLSAPGTADMTAHVDFAAFAAAAHDTGAATHGPIPQGVFLARLGLFQRTNRLARGQPPARALRLTDAARRLAEPDRMGRLFKAMALSSPGCAMPPGFAG
jgi:SAM-dependent MidA family methyltransferase